MRVTSEKSFSFALRIACSPKWLRNTKRGLVRSIDATGFGTVLGLQALLVARLPLVEAVAVQEQVAHRLRRRYRRRLR